MKSTKFGNNNEWILHLADNGSYVDASHRPCEDYPTHHYKPWVFYFKRKCRKCKRKFPSALEYYKTKKKLLTQIKVEKDQRYQNWLEKSKIEDMKELTDKVVDI